MKRLVTIMLVLACAGALALGVYRAIARHRAAAGQGAAGERRVPVAVVPAVLSNIEAAVSATGDVESWEEVNVSAQVGEKLTVILVNEGDMLTAGSVIAELDDDEAQASYEAACATVRSMETGLNETYVSLTNTMRSFSRTEQLHAQNVIGQQEYDNADTALQLARTKVAIAAALLNQARAKQEELHVRLKRYTIRAPFEGVVAQRFFDPGSYVSPGEPIVRMTRVNPITVKAQLPEAAVSQVRPGCLVRVRLWGGNGAALTGSVVRIYPVLDARWRTQTVEVQCPNDAGAAQPGMFARLQIVTGTADALLVPDVAVMKLPGSGITHLYIVRDGLARRVDASIVQDLGALVSVTGDLAPGDLVIVKGQQRVQTGAAVDAIPTEMLP
ncbi:efflux RND transporter periplasmic adaptor subunit [bacterium]|nr:efflux RND transporter periplasmic adaptor subunit [bacterium]